MSKDHHDEQETVQKSVLVSRSEYFRAMFRNDMRESGEKNVIQVRDCSKDVLIMLLIWKWRIYASADGYQAAGLCKCCVPVEAMEKCLTNQTFVPVLVKVDRTN